MMAAFIAASDLAAQRPATTRPRDSIVVRVLGPGMSLDSLRALVQQFDREQAGTQRFFILGERIDSLVRSSGGPGAAAFVRGVFTGSEASRIMLDSRRGWLGFYTQGPSQKLQMLNGDLFVTNFTHPLIVSVDPQSPAEKAGIAAGDVLVAYNGVDVVNHEFNLGTLLKPDAKVTVTVLRDGETKDYQLTVAKAPQRIADRRVDFETSVAPPGAAVGGRRVEVRRLPPGTTDVIVPGEGPLVGRLGAAIPLSLLSTNGVLGASVSTVNAELARALNLKAGVLVNDVPDGTPAYRAGLRAGDVITSADDQPIASLAQLRGVLVRARAHAVELQVAHNQKTRTVTLNLSQSP